VTPHGRLHFLNNLIRFFKKAKTRDPFFLPDDLASQATANVRNDKMRNGIGVKRGRNPDACAVGRQIDQANGEITFPALNHSALIRFNPSEATTLDLSRRITILFFACHDFGFLCRDLLRKTLTRDSVYRYYA